jgi:hypothetical protein
VAVAIPSSFLPVRLVSTCRTRSLPLAPRQSYCCKFCVDVHDSLLAMVVSPPQLSVGKYCRPVGVHLADLTGWVVASWSARSHWHP